MAAHLLLACASGAAFGLPLCAVAMAIARAFGSATARYRVYAIAFTAALLDAPLAFVFSGDRAAALVPFGRALAVMIAAHAPIAIVSAAGAVALALLGRLVVDMIVLMRIKAGSRVHRAIAPDVRNALVASSSRVRTPTAIGYLHPRIVLPDDLAARVNDDELRAIIAHERAHLVRFDDWAKAVQSAVTRASWFAPALWLLAARMDLERELATDERVLASSVEARVYAACLVRLAADIRNPLPAPAAWLGRSQVGIRVERLLRPRRDAGGPVTMVCAALFAIAVFASGAAAIVCVPEGTSARPIALVPAPVPVLASRVVPRRPARRTVAVATRAVIPAGTHRARPVAYVAAPAVGAPTSRHVAVRPPSVPKMRPAAGGATEVAMTASLRGCRTCVFFRRPFSVWPAAPALEETAVRPVRRMSVPVPAPFGEADDLAGSRGYPWDPAITGGYPASVLLGPN